MEKITSLQNQLVKKTAELKQKKYRELTGTFFLEGKRAVEEALEADWQLFAVFCTEENIAQAENFGGKAPSYEVDEKVMSKIAATESPQGIGAVVKMKDYGPLENLKFEEGTVLVLDGVRDPGNVGTIIRTADAAGVKAVVLLDETVDLYNPKVIRSTMGSLFHIPVYTKVTEEELTKWAKAQEAQIWATSLDGATDLFTEKWPRATVLVMGSEAEGVRRSLQQAADKRIFIPMQGRAESLNVAVATGICLFSKR